MHGEDLQVREMYRQEALMAGDEQVSEDQDQDQDQEAGEQANRRTVQEVKEKPTTDRRS
jgi:hypothetical protein